jgi:transposase
MINNLPIEKKEECVLRYKKGESLKVLEIEYHITRTTIYRWAKQYNGTLSSLDPKLSRKNMNHPKKMPFEEEQLLLKIVDSNPNISDRELAELLGTKRNPAFLYRKRKKLLGKRIISYKNDYRTFFNADKIIEINQSDYKRGVLPDTFYIIEILNNLYLQKSISGNPVSITPYFSMCLQFPTTQHAYEFIKSLEASNKSNWAPTIREVKDGILQGLNKE